MSATMADTTRGTADYSIAPNGATATKGVSTSAPGAWKLVYATGLLGTGAVGNTGSHNTDQTLACPNLVAIFCTEVARSTVTGYPSPRWRAFLRSHSVSSYLKQIEIPVLLGKGETDTLFNLNEAAATYQALRAQHTPVKMIWNSWGHSNGAIGAPGEFDVVHPSLSRQYEWKRIFNWFQHYLRNKNVTTGPAFSYFRNWVPYRGSAAPAYATAPSYPVGRPQTYYLSGTGSLVRDRRAVTSGSQTFATPVAGAPTSTDPLVFLTATAPSAPEPEADLPGTAVSWDTPPLRKPLDVVGIPRVTLKFTAPVAAAAENPTDPASQLVVFVKLVDVAPNGRASLIKYQNMPVRIPDVGRPVHIALGGIVHRFAPGHRLRLTVAGGSANFRGNPVPNIVQIASGARQVLAVPTV